MAGRREGRRKRTTDTHGVRTMWEALQAESRFGFSIKNGKEKKKKKKRRRKDMADLPYLRPLTPTLAFFEGCAVLGDFVLEGGVVPWMEPCMGAPSMHGGTKHAWGWRRREERRVKNTSCFVATTREVFRGRERVVRLFQITLGLGEVF